MTAKTAKKQLKKKQKAKKLIANRSSTKVSTATRVARSQLISTVATQSPLWTSVPALKSTGTDVITAGTTIDEDEKNIAKLELDLATARTKKEQDHLVFDSRFDIFVDTVEDKVVDPKEMQELAVDPLVGTKYAITTPLGVTGTSDPAQHDITAKVKRGAGMRRAVIEVSSDATMATGVKQFPGDGMEQTMGPFPPGTYYLRACHVRSAERSDYTEIVSVIVK